MPFGGESGWDRTPRKQSGWALVGSSVPFGGESGWDTALRAEATRATAQSSVPFGGESGWDGPDGKPSKNQFAAGLQCLSAVSPGGTPTLWAEAAKGPDGSSVPFGGESGWDHCLHAHLVGGGSESSVPFGGESGWDLRKPPTPTPKPCGLQCLSAVSPGGTLRSRLGNVDKLPRSSVPFGGESGWDGALTRKGGRSTLGLQCLSAVSPGGTLLIPTSPTPRMASLQCLSAVSPGGTAGPLVPPGGNHPVFSAFRR